MNRVIAILFGVSCFFTSTLSSRMLGVGIWFWIIIAAGIVVAVSQFIPNLAKLGGSIASLLSVISVLAVVLTLLAATTGGSFQLGTNATLLVFAFSMIAVLGFLLARMNKKLK